MKMIFERKVKNDDFQLCDSVLKWDVGNEDKGKHGKFYNLWKGPYIISAFSVKNAYFLEDSNGNQVTSRRVNGIFLKHYLTA
jgi:hypothetical protein